MIGCVQDVAVEENVCHLTKRYAVYVKIENILLTVADTVNGLLYVDDNVQAIMYCNKVAEMVKVLW